MAKRVKDVSVLMVCDDEHCSKEVFNNLKRIYKITDITIATSKKQAYEYYKINEFDIVVTNFLMSNKNFKKLVNKIREINDEQIFVSISKLNNKKEFLKAIRLRIRYFLQYPLQEKEFKKVFNACIKRTLNRYERTFSNSILKQYKDTIDKTTILSKSDKNGIITYVNDKLCEISKYDAIELIGQDHSILRHEDMEEEVFRQMWNTIKQEKKTWQGVIKNKAKDGSTYIVDAIIIPILNHKNEIIEFLAIRHDITQLETYKELLKDRLNLTELGLVEKIHHIQEIEKAIDYSTSFVKTDILGKITYVNDKFCEISGYCEDELIGHDFKKLREESVSSQTYKKMWETLQNKKPWQGILKNKAKDGKIYYVDSTIIPITDTNENVVEYISIKHDISDIIYLNKEIIDTQKEVVDTMGTICEGRSKETGNHVKRVAEYSFLLAKLYGLPRKECELIKLASPVHDIGKIAIPDEVLKKPSKLTKDEFEIIKEHSKFGYEMLKNSNREILQAAATIAHEHHEKFDGSGYPRGLSGEDIHIYGRITAVCDVFDALGSDRYYKKAWELERILNMFKEERGKHFDPKLIDLFFDNLDSFLKIRDLYKDI